MLIPLAALATWLLWPNAVSVSTVLITPITFQEYVEEEGKTRPRELHVIASPVLGTLVRPELKVGDAVQKDAVLATILPGASSPMDPQTRKEREANFEKARLQFQQAKREYERQKSLKEKEIISQSEFEQSVLQYGVSKRDFEAAQFALKAAYTKPDKKNAVNVLAPVSGQILRVFNESGGPVAIGTPIFEMADVSQLEVVVDVLTSDAPKIAKNAKVILKRWGGEGELMGQVRQVEPGAFTKVSALGVEEQRVNIVVDLLSKPEQWKDKLGAGYRVDTQIVTHEAKNAVTAPLSSLFRDQDGWAVFVIEDGKAHKRRVVFTHKNNHVALIETGLKANDRVIEYPSDAVKEGVRVITG